MRILDFIAESNQTSDRAKLYLLLEETASAMGYDRYAYGTLVGYDREASSDLPAPAVALNYPAGWTEHYFEQGYQDIDPVIQYSPEISRPFLWSDLAGRVGLTAGQRRFLDEAQEAGICDGITVPLHGPHGRVAVMCFASSKLNSRRDLQMGYLKAIAAQFEMVHESLAARPLPGNVLKLSQRELDCLSWTALGKSSWDISMILGISENTVNYHIKNTMKKFGTNSRIVAVVKAIRLNMLTP